MSPTTWITLWNEGAAHWTGAMWRAGWQGGLFVVIVWIVCRMRQDIPSRVRYGLWWLVCLKLLLGLCPVFFALPLLPPAATSMPLSANSITASPGPAAVRSPALRPVNLPSNIRTIAGRETRPRLSGLAWIMGFWFVVTGLLFGASALSLYRFRSLRRVSEPVTDPTLVAMATEAATAIGIRTRPELLITKQDVGVLTLGARRPVVLVSQQALSTCSPSEMQLVMAHEFSHIQRGDAWLGLLPHLTQILFWFHPLVWLACRELVLAREAACDELTIHALQARSDLYGRLLLKLGVRQTSWFTLCTPGVSSHFRILHRRISMLARISEGSPRRRRSHSILLACLVGATLTAPWSLVRAQNPTLTTSGHTAPGSRSGIQHRVAGGRVVTVNGGDASLTQKQRDALDAKAGKRPLVLAGTTAPLPGNAKTPPQAIKKQPLPGIDTRPIPAGSADTGRSLPQTRVFKLRFADADSVARTLTTLFGDVPGKPTKIVADTRTNVIIIQAGPEMTKEIYAIVEELDTETSSKLSEADTMTQVFPVKYLLSADLAHTLTSLFGAKSGKPVTIVADTQTNTIIVQADGEQISRVKGLLATLDIETKKP